ncbi:MAG: archease [Spirochaetes bacterium]|nr:archease [Spirochaetota bacterium]
MSWRFVDDLTVADTGFEADGASLLELLGSAVDATLAVMVGEPANLRPQQAVRVRLEGSDPAGLLFELLQEVIFRKDAEGLFLRFADGCITERSGMLTLAATLRGETLDRSRHEAGTDVKAVTLHRFEVVEQAGRWRASVVLDV